MYKNNISSSDSQIKQMLYMLMKNHNVPTINNYKKNKPQQFEHMEVAEESSYYRHLDINEIENRLQIIPNKNLLKQYHDIYIINLEQRSDRLNSVINQLGHMNNIRLIKFKAFNNSDGRIGCAESHMALVKYAQLKNMKYIVVVEDDLLLSDKLENNELINVLRKLTTNYDSYKIFNGSPMFFYPINEIKKYESGLPGFYFVEHCTKATFIIYTHNVYKELLEYNPYHTHHAIDGYIEVTFRQLCYKKHLCYEIISHSNIYQREVNQKVEDHEIIYNRMPVIYIRGDNILNPLKFSNI